jgi:hypothetical protein
MPMMPSASDSSVLRARRLPLVLALPLAGLLLPASPLLADGWPMGGANPQRTAWCSEEVPGGLWPVWYRPIEPYIPQNVQVIVTEGRLYLSTARGLYCIKADNGEVAWVYPTELPLGHCPTVVDGVVYVGGFDRKIHAIGAATGKGLWTFDGAGAAFHTNPLVIGGKVYAGNRDGNLYCIGAHKAPNAGKLIWKFPTGGPVNQSAAYDDGKVTVAPYGSSFVVFQKAIATTAAGTVARNDPTWSEPHALDGGWELAFDKKWGGPESVQFDQLVSWTTRAEPGIKYYSGKATYRKTFDPPAALTKGGRLRLNLGVVKNVAEVRLNGRHLGVAWTEPFSVDITGALKPAANKLEIDVINLWPNRLIGDATLPAGKRLTRTSVSFDPKAPLLDSGLLGPVTLQTTR